MREKNIFGFINTKVRERILREIIIDNASLTTISRRIGVSTPAVLKNIKLFKYNKIIKENRDSKGKVYYKINKPIFGFFYFDDYTLMLRGYENEGKLDEYGLNLLEIDKKINNEINKLLDLFNQRREEIIKIIKELDMKEMDETKKRIIKLYLSGLDTKEIAKEMNIYESEIKKILIDFFNKSQ